jgi:predicted MPP superfamily phosphohydrolase
VIAFAYRLHFFPDFVLLVVCLAAQLRLSSWLLQAPAWKSWPRHAGLLAFNALVAALFCSTYLLTFHRFWRYVPLRWNTWIVALGLALAVCLIGIFAGAVIWRPAGKMQTPRRQFLQVAGAAAAVAPCAVFAFGIVRRAQFRLNQVDIPVPGLPKDLDGLRIVQITDIHLSPFLSEGEFARCIDMANETRAHVAVVGGDLISRTGDPLDACLRQLGRLRADAGVIGCMGNHEVYTQTEDYVTREGKRIGIDFLRTEARRFRFGDAVINFAGVDYQRYGRPYLLGADKLVLPGQLNILLSHNPDVFPAAADQGYLVTIAGHTHGGQVNFEILHQNINVARYFTPYVRGLYHRGPSSIYVSSGIGTIGVPVRVGAPAEVALLRLCAS